MSIVEELSNRKLATLSEDVPPIQSQEGITTSHIFPSTGQSVSTFFAYPSIPFSANLYLCFVSRGAIHH
jgi:hypothetical protein